MRLQKLISEEPIVFKINAKCCYISSKWPFTFDISNAVLVLCALYCIYIREGNESICIFLLTQSLFHLQDRLELRKVYKIYYCTWMEEKKVEREIKREKLGVGWNWEQVYEIGKETSFRLWNLVMENHDIWIWSIWCNEKIL